MPAETPYAIHLIARPDDITYLCPDLTTDDATSLLIDLETHGIDLGSGTGLAMLSTFLECQGYAVDLAYRDES